MKKYKVSASVVQYYQELEIEASERSEAVDIYLNLIKRGKVISHGTEFIDKKVREA